MNDNSNDYTANAVSSAHINSAHTNSHPEPTPKIRSETNIQQDTIIPNDSDIQTINTTHNG